MPVTVIVTAAAAAAAAATRPLAMASFFSALTCFLGLAPRLSGARSLLGLFGAVLFLGSSLPSPAQTSSNAALDAVSRGSLRSILAPRHDLKLSSRAAGVVEKIHLPEGSPVSAGQPLLSLDSQQEAAELAQAQATLRSIEVEFERASSDFARAQALFQDRILAEKQFDEYRTNHLVLKNRRDQARSSVELAQIRFDNRTLRSPIDGVFLKTSKSVGEAVERLETIARVVDASSLRLMVFCDASLLHRFSLGQEVSVQVQPSPERNATVLGHVVHLDPIVDAASGTFRVIVEVPPSSDAIAGIPGLLQLTHNSVQKKP